MSAITVKKRFRWASLRKGKRFSAAKSKQWKHFFCWPPFWKWKFSSRSLIPAHTHTRAHDLVRKHATKCDQEKTRWRQCRRRFWTRYSEYECVWVRKGNPLLAHSWTFPSRCSNTVLVLERNVQQQQQTWGLSAMFSFCLGLSPPAITALLVVENLVCVSMRRHSEPYWERRGGTRKPLFESRFSYLWLENSTNAIARRRECSEGWDKNCDEIIGLDYVYFCKLSCTKIFFLLRAISQRSVSLCVGPSKYAKGRDMRELSRPSVANVWKNITRFQIIV